MVRMLAGFCWVRHLAGLRQPYKDCYSTRKTDAPVNRGKETRGGREGWRQGAEALKEMLSLFTCLSESAAETQLTVSCTDTDTDETELLAALHRICTCTTSDVPG